MARSDDTLVTLLVLGIGGYLVYTYYFSPTAQAAAAASPAASSAGGSSILCKFPDNTTAPMLANGTCPFDSNHGGQSTPCYPTSYVGPIPTGGATC